MPEKYNGWTNYATWRVNLEMFDGYDEEVTADQLESMADEMITNYGEIPTSSLAVSYANAFMSDVNWHEIAEAINETIEE